MNDKDKHTPSYSSSDIEKYLNGELSAPEMHALERAALDDPFLADALDGMEIHRHLPGQPSFHQDVAGLHQRLQDRVAEKEKTRVRRIPPFMRYAAAVILLAGLGLTAYYTFFADRFRKNEISAVQRHVEDPPAASDAAPAPAAKSTAPTGDAKSTAPAEPAAAPSSAAENAIPPADTPVTRSLAKTRRTPPLADAQPARSADTLSRSQALAIIPRESALETPRMRFDTVSFDKNLAYQANDQKDAALLKQRSAGMKVYNFSNNNYKTASIGEKTVFSGKVTDQHNNPIPGASVTLKNDQTSNAITDKNGQFNLQVNQKWDKWDSSYTAVVNRTGYESGSIYLNTENKKSNFIQLQPQTGTLNEVQIVGFGSKRKEIMRQNIDARQKDLSLVAVPTMGWPAYRDYLESGKKIANLDSTLSGNETISFIVNYKGELSSFKVEQSISPAHDSATIRMIRQGPAWHLTSGKKARARVILTY